ncbi:MAG: N-acetylmuramoyl-L-alanine amidase, partial [Planctomycetota bacterium]
MPGAFGDVEGLVDGAVDIEEEVDAEAPHVDGTIYQTLDVTERAWHATKANSRSVGIEIAQIGAYPPG